LNNMFQPWPGSSSGALLQLFYKPWLLPKTSLVPRGRKIDSEQGIQGICMWGITSYSTWFITKCNFYKLETQIFGICCTKSSWT
jgi:hypothetical protein